MGNKALFTTAQRAHNVTQSKVKLSEHQTGKKLKVSKIAVYNSIEKFSKKGTFTDRKITGRFHIVSNKDRRLMKRMIARLPMTSEEKDQFQLQKKGCIVCTRTVQRRLYTEFGLKLHIPA